MSILEITNTDRHIWQRRAAARLVHLLDEHPDLPRLDWTISRVGSGLWGRVAGLRPAATMRAEFNAWATALALPEGPETVSLGMAYRQARARRDSVDIVLLANIIGDDEEESR